VCKALLIIDLVQARLAPFQSGNWRPGKPDPAKLAVPSAPQVAVELLGAKRLGESLGSTKVDRSKK
jgi:hypothetical protein